MRFLPLLINQWSNIAIISYLGLSSNLIGIGASIKLLVYTFNYEVSKTECKHEKVAGSSNLYIFGLSLSITLYRPTHKALSLCEPRKYNWKILHVYYQQISWRKDDIQMMLIYINYLLRMYFHYRNLVSC